MDDRIIDAAIGLSGARELAEQQLLGHLRGGGEPLRVTIEHADGEWTVCFASPGDGMGSGIGNGRSFAEAWHRLRPAWAPQNDDTKGGR